MKLNLTVEATAQELREFFGLPNVQPLQEEMLAALREQLFSEQGRLDPAALIKPFLLPQQVHSMESLQKAFWNTFAKAAAADTPPERGGD